jgi:hypothetical protein
MTQLKRQAWRDEWTAAECQERWLFDVDPLLKTLGDLDELWVSGFSAPQRSQACAHRSKTAWERDNRCDGLMTPASTCLLHYPLCRFESRHRAHALVPKRSQD